MCYESCADSDFSWALFLTFEQFFFSRKSVSKKLRGMNPNVSNEYFVRKKLTLHVEC